MSISERQKQILNFLNERNFITVKELSAITFTSQSSIRRDLTYLENNGLVKRLHGGVSSIEPSLPLIPKINFRSVLIPLNPQALW